MLDNRYYKGYEGEGSVAVWCEGQGGKVRNGLLVWRGFFETILEGCFTPNFDPEGMVACYYHQTGFYDGKWKMRAPLVVIDELMRFDESILDTDNESIIRKAKDVISQLLAFLDNAVEEGTSIYIECD